MGKRPYHVVGVEGEQGWATDPPFKWGPLAAQRFREVDKVVAVVGGVAAQEPLEGDMVFRMHFNSGGKKLGLQEEAHFRLRVLGSRISASGAAAIRRQQQPQPSAAAPAAANLPAAPAAANMPAPPTTANLPAAPAAASLSAPSPPPGANLAATLHARLVPTTKASFLGLCMAVSTATSGRVSTQDMMENFTLQLFGLMLRVDAKEAGPATMLFLLLAWTSAHTGHMNASGKDAFSEPHHIPTVRRIQLMAKEGYDLGMQKVAMFDYTPSPTNDSKPTPQQKEDGATVLPLIVNYLRDNNYLAAEADAVTFGTLTCKLARMPLRKLNITFFGAYHPSPRGVTLVALVTSFWVAMEPMRGIPSFVPLF